MDCDTTAEASDASAQIFLVKRPRCRQPQVISHPVENLLWSTFVLFLERRKEQSIFMYFLGTWRDQWISPFLQILGLQGSGACCGVLPGGDVLFLFAQPKDESVFVNDSRVSFGYFWYLSPTFLTDCCLEQLCS